MYIRTQFIPGLLKRYYFINDNIALGLSLDGKLAFYQKGLFTLQQRGRTSVQV